MWDLCAISHAEVSMLSHVIERNVVISMCSTVLIDLIPLHNSLNTAEYIVWLRVRLFPLCQW